MPALRIPDPAPARPTGPLPPDPWPTKTPVPRRVINDIPLQDRILEDYINGTLTPFAVAKKHDLTVDQLIAFIRSDAVCARLKDLENFAKDRARTLAILHLPSAITALADAILRDNRAESRRAASTIVRELNRRNSILHRPGDPGSPSPWEGVGGGSSDSKDLSARPRRSAGATTRESGGASAAVRARGTARERSDSAVPSRAVANPYPPPTDSEVLPLQDLHRRNGHPKPNLRLARGTSPPRP